VDQTAAGPEQQQPLARLPPRLFEKPSGEFTCGTCQFFDAEANRCTLRKFGTLAHFVACEAYDPRRLAPLLQE